MPGVVLIGNRQTSGHGPIETVICPLSLSKSGAKCEILLFQSLKIAFKYEAHHEKTCHRGLRPGSAQIGLYSHRRWLEV